MLVSPAEPKAIKILGRSSSIPEQYGADILFATKQGTVGVQRKEVKDFVASMRDGRIAKELAQLKNCDLAVLVTEGSWRWTTDGNSLAVRGWSIAQLRGAMFGMQSQGIWTAHTESMEATIEFVSHLKSWLEKNSHGSLGTRPKPANSWGTRSNSDWALWILQSFEGIGRGQAEKIMEYFGHLPLSWTVTYEELMKVPGIGKGRATKLWEALK